VPNVIDINCDVPTTSVVTAAPWHARPGAFAPLSAAQRPAFPGTVLPAAGLGTGPSALVRPVPRVRDKAAVVGRVVPVAAEAALVVPAPQAAVMAQLEQTNNYIQMTSTPVFGEGASGPPPDREPA
jgi:anti-sigma factor RsiW